VQTSWTGRGRLSYPHQAAAPNVPELLRSILIRQRIAAMAAGQDSNDPPLHYFYDKLPLPVLTS
jgi:hypothetical protein